MELNLSFCSMGLKITICNCNCKCSYNLFSYDLFWEGYEFYIFPSLVHIIYNLSFKNTTKFKCHFVSQYEISSPVLWFPMLLLPHPSTSPNHHEKNTWEGFTPMG